MQYLEFKNKCNDNLGKEDGKESLTAHFKVDAGSANGEGLWGRSDALPNYSLLADP